MLLAGGGALSGRRVLVVTLDVLGPRMAGPAIRAWHVAEALSSQHDVVLATVKPLGLPPGRLDLRHVDESELRLLVQWCEVVIFQGFVLQQFPWLGDTDKVLIVDAYAPLHLEQLEQSGGLGRDAHRHVVASGVAALDQQLARADFVLCASERQRDLWLGHLGALGRVNPDTYAQDPSLRRLIDVVPFGLPDRPPVRLAPAIRGVVPGIGDQDKVLLWGGGVYNWFDPLTLLHAVAQLADAHPEIKLFFLGLVHPNPDVEEMDMAREARRLSAELGLTGRSVFFNETWVPYERRGDYLLDADVGVSTHRDHVETRFAFRTRVLDYLWASLPVVLTEGDALADLTERRGSGRTVPAGDADALARAVLAVLEESEASLCRARAADLAQEYRWSLVLEPLTRFVATASRAADSGRPHVARRAGRSFAGLRRDVAVGRARLRTGGLRAVLPGVRRRLGAL